MTDLTVRLARQPAVLRWAGLALAGAVAALGHPPFGLAVATLAGLWVLMRAVGAAPSWRQAALMGWVLGTGYFTVSLHWIVEPFLVEPEVYGWMAPFGLLFTATGMALFWALGAGLAAVLAREGAGRALALAVALTGAEYLRSTILTGFPWALPGHVWIGTPVAQLARLVGPHGLTLLTLLIPAAFVALTGRLGAVRGGAVTLAGIAALVAGCWGWDRATLIAPQEGAPIVRLVQPNAPQDEKWIPGRAVAFFDRSLAFTSAGEVPDLVVWPETSVPWFLDQAQDALETISEHGRGAPVVVGIQRYDPPRYYNALAVIGRGGAVQSLYDKTHLVPFGEFVPFGDIAARFGLRGLASNEGGGYSAGTGPVTMDLPGIGRMLPLICYEGIFAEEVGAWDARPRLLLLITNDAWFGTFAGPYQHLAQARLRAIEQGLPMVRAANTGVSAMIDARGRITAELPLGEAGWRDAALPPAAPLTLYARTGDLPVVLLLFAAAAAFIWARMRNPVDPAGPQA